MTPETAQAGSRRSGGFAERSHTAKLPVRFYTVSQIAGMTGLSQDSVRREISCGSLTAHRFRRMWRIKDQDFEAWANRSRYCPTAGVTFTYELASASEDYRW